MKKLISSIVVSIAAILTTNAALADSQRADESAPALTTLTALNCVAANGVTLKNSEKPKEQDFFEEENPSTGPVNQQGLKVAAAWGFAKKEFNAYLAASNKEATVQINLDGKKGTEYILVLKADKTKATQTADGTIVQPSNTKGIQARPVTMVRCELTLH